MTKTNVNAIPDDAIRALARSLLPTIRTYFESAEGQQEFAEWQSQQGAETKSAVAEVEKLPLAS